MRHWAPSAQRAALSSSASFSLRILPEKVFFPTFIPTRISESPHALVGYDQDPRQKQRCENAGRDVPTKQELKVSLMLDSYLSNDRRSVS